MQSLVSCLAKKKKKQKKQTTKDQKNRKGAEASYKSKSILGEKVFLVGRLMILALRVVVAAVAAAAGDGGIGDQRAGSSPRH